MLNKALSEKKVRTASKKKRVVLTFPSPYARERFAARFRAIKLNVVDATGEPRATSPYLGGGELAASSNSLAALPSDEMLKIFCGTFNVGDKGPPKPGLLRYISNFDVLALSLFGSLQTTKSWTCGFDLESWTCTT